MSEAPEMPERIWMGSIVNGGEGKSYVRDDIHRADIHSAVKRAIEACAEACDANHRGNLPKHIQSADGLLLRKWLSNPETIAKIVEGK